MTASVVILVFLLVIVVQNLFAGTLGGWLKAKFLGKAG